MSDTELTTAAEHHDGSICPACQTAVRTGDPIHLCAKCGASSHEACWRREGGCTSYFCRKERKADVGGAAGITISKSEAENLPEAKLLPSATVYPEGRDGRYPKRFSKAAILSLLLGTLSSLGMSAAMLSLMGSPEFRSDLGSLFLVAVVPGLIWVACMALAVFSLVAIAGNSRLKGAWMSVTSILLNIGLVVIIPVIGFNVSYNPGRLDKIEFRDPPEALDSVEDPAIRTAMRANVVVHTSGQGFMGGVITGSGVIVDLDAQRALIITNRHVIDPTFSEGRSRAPASARIEVIFCGKERVDATVKWYHPNGLDLALLECQPTDIKRPAAANFDLPTASGIGADVFAVGNPMEHGWTYTQGVISSVRERVLGSLRIKIYQTQTPINQGNSGGGLYNVKGKLIGINSWTLSKSIAENLNFAIALEAAREALKPLMDKRSARPARPEKPKG